MQIKLNQNPINLLTEMLYSKNSNIDKNISYLYYKMMHIKISLQELCDIKYNIFEFVKNNLNKKKYGLLVFVQNVALHKTQEYCRNIRIENYRNVALDTIVSSSKIYNNNVLSTNRIKNKYINVENLFIHLKNDIDIYDIFDKILDRIYTQPIKNKKVIELIKQYNNNPTEIIYKKIKTNFEHLKMLLVTYN
jgi:hypothetical protein